MEGAISRLCSMTTLVELVVMAEHSCYNSLGVKRKRTNILNAREMSYRDVISDSRIRTQDHRIAESKLEEFELEGVHIGNTSS